MERTQTPGIYRVGSRYVVVTKWRGKQVKTFHRTMAEAREVKARRVRDPRPPSRVRFDDYASTWLTNYRGRTKRGALAESTRISYARTIAVDLVPYFRGARLVEIGASDVRALFTAMEKRGRTPSAVRNARAVLSAMLATAAEDGHVQTNAARGVRYVPTTRPSLEEEQATRERLRPLTRAEAAALLDAIGDERQRLFVRFLMSTGLRVGEAVGLTWKHVDLGSNPRILVREQVHAGRRTTLKTPSAVRDVPLSPVLADALRAMRRDGYRGEDAPVFATTAGTPLNPSAVAGRIVKPAAASIGLPWVHCHTFRRTAGAWLLQEGRTPVQVQRFLGHADAGFTLRSTYVGLVDEGVGDAALFDAALDARRDVAVGTQKATQHPQDDAGPAPELAA
jgi:integrase